MSLATGDLTTLATLKAYVVNPPADTVLSGLITRISRFVHGQLNRHLLVPKTYTQQFDGSGTRQLILPEWPVISLSSLSIGGCAVPFAPQPTQSPPPAPNVSPYFGWRFQPWDGVPPGEPASLELQGISYYGGRQNVVVTYAAGYQVTGEQTTVPTPPASLGYTPLCPFGSWATDQGVTYASGAQVGVALKPVGVITAAGQYIPPSPSGESPVLGYTFAAADAGALLNINYGFIPADIEQVVLELIAERASYRNRVSERTHSLGGQETVAFDLSGMSRFVVDSLLEYVSVLPPPMGALL
jgi:hypothetical protein